MNKDKRKLKLKALIGYAKSYSEVRIQGQFNAGR